MRITTHGNDLLVTDQSLGLGAFLLAMGVLLLVAAIDRALGGSLLSVATAFYAVVGLVAVKGGLNRLVATQLIVDTDRNLLIAKRWALSGTDIQRIPFQAVEGFSIEPPGQNRRTELLIHTSRGPVRGSGGTKGAREAWEEVVAAVEAHMGRHSDTSTN